MKSLWVSFLKRFEKPKPSPWSVSNDLPEPERFYNVRQVRLRQPRKS